MNTTKNPVENKIKRFWRDLGPGLTTGAADDDPSGITTYSQAGAAFGYRFLWSALLTFPFMALVQEMCARIGLVTGRGLASAMREYLPRNVLYLAAFLLFITNTINIAADLGLMAKAVQLVLPSLNFVLLLFVFVLITLFVEVFASYQSYARVLKWLSLILFVYVFTAFAVKVDWGQALASTFWPHIGFSKEELFLLTAVLGTTISPYLFFWQTSQEVEEQINEGKLTIKSREAVTTKAEVTKMRKDVWSGMFISNIVMFFIIVVCAASLNQNHIFSITDAAAAASALKPLAGQAAYFLFTLGILGTGMLAIPILAGSSSYAISETLGWHEGLYRRFKKAYAFYGIIIASLLLGLFLNFLHVDTIKLLIDAAVLNGLIAPIVLAAIVRLSSDKKVMKEWVNTPLVTFFGWVITAAMTGVAFFTIWSLLV